MTTPKVSDIVGIINKVAPAELAEPWDNVGLQVGDPAAEAARIMVALDANEVTLSAAIDAQCSLLLTHHPLLLKPLTKVSAGEPTGALLSRAIRGNVTIVAAHTNYDIVNGGLNDLLAARLGLTACEPLVATASEELVKLAVYVPEGHEAEVMAALFRCGGVIGNYADCSFRTSGIGTYRPLAGAQPFLGKVGHREEVAEFRLEVLVRKSLLGAAVKALLKAHPYEEPAYDLYPLLNRDEPRGLGRIGVLPESLPLATFARNVMGQLGANSVRLVGQQNVQVRRVALCGGSGATLLREARTRGADVLVTGDVKYHDARDAETFGIAVVDAGHFATETLAIQGLAQALGEELQSRRLEAEVICCQAERDPFVTI